MSWHLVAGVALPDAVGGHPALDFCNTRAGWVSALAGGPAKEYLTSPRALTLWALDAGLLTPPSDVDDDPDAVEDDPAGALPRAIALRDALYRAAIGQGTAADWRALSHEIAQARGVATLRPGDSGAARWHLDDPAPSPLAALHAVAGAAEELLTSPLVNCVAACPGAGCGWLFADRRRRRRWCSMAVCGNRAKARRHAERSGANPVDPGRKQHQPVQIG